MYREQFNCNLYLFQFSLLHKPCLALPREPFSEVLNHFSVCLIWLCDKLGTKQKLISAEHPLKTLSRPKSRFHLHESYKAKQSSTYFSFPVKKLTSSGEKPHNHYRFPHTAAAADFFLNIVNTSCVKCTYLNANDKNMRKFPLFQHLHCNALVVVRWCK